MRLLLTALFAISTPALAQSNRGVLPASQSRMLVERYANCVVQYDATHVRVALRAYIAGRIADFPLIHLCARSPNDVTEISFTSDVYRFAMAEALYVADYGKTPVAEFDAIPLSSPPDVAAVETGKFPIDSRRVQAVLDAHAHVVGSRYMLIIGDCIVRTDPGATHSLVTSKAESKDEVAALIAIQPVLAQCLPAGQTVQFNRTSLRGILALSAYRLSDAVTELSR